MEGPKSEQQEVLRWLLVTLQALQVELIDRHIAHTKGWRSRKIEAALHARRLFIEIAHYVSLADNQVIELGEKVAAWDDDEEWDMDAGCDDLWQFSLDLANRCRIAMDDSTADSRLVPHSCK